MMLGEEALEAGQVTDVQSARTQSGMPTFESTR